MKELARCGKCGGRPAMEQEYYGSGWSVYCVDCCDGAPDDPHVNRSGGRDRQDAIERWESDQEDILQERGAV